MVLWILLGVACFLLVATLGISYICFRMAFYVPKKEEPTQYPLPHGRIYQPHHEKMKLWMDETRKIPYEEVSITSFDGLKLYGKYYEYAPGAPIELMMHGYRGLAERDLCGGVQRCAKLGRSALIIDQRACGKSDGKVISFGVNEHRDCLAWVDFMVQKFGPEVKIYLCGISMGASTVLMAAGKELPANVVGVLADCGYSSAKAIIKKVIRQMGLPAGISYPFVKLGARLYGGFCLEETPSVESVKQCKIPVLLIHGDTDDFVPCYMSRENYDACASRKRLLTVPGAGHGLCYVIDPETYVATLREFFAE